MVAINLPRSRDDWTLGFRRDAAQEHQPDDRRWDGVPHIPNTGPSARPGAEPADLVRRPRALPDRATRVRRRRLAALVAALLLVLVVIVAVQVAAWLIDVGGSPAPEPLDSGRARPVAGQEYVVQPGDTLWSIATEIAPDRDPRAVVDALRDANGGPALEVGDRLTIVLD